MQQTGERIIPADTDEFSLIFERHKFSYACALNFAEGKNCLDVGCGTGYGCMMLSQKANRVTGIDFAPDAIRYAKKNYHRDNIGYLVMNGEAIGFKDESFAVITAIQVIEHLRPEPFLAETVRLLHPGGTLLVATPHVPADTAPLNPFHRKEYHWQELTELLRGYFPVVKVGGIVFARSNLLRTVLARSGLLYRVGSRLKRTNPVKTAGSRLAGLRKFKLTFSPTEAAMDLIAICVK